MRNCLFEWINKEGKNTNPDVNYQCWNSPFEDNIDLASKIYSFIRPYEKLQCYHDDDGQLIPYKNGKIMSLNDYKKMLTNDEYNELKNLLQKYKYLNWAQTRTIKWHELINYLIIIISFDFLRLFQIKNVDTIKDIIKEWEIFDPDKDQKLYHKLIKEVWKKIKFYKKEFQDAADKKNQFYTEQEENENQDEKE